jgi:type IV secretory pathway TraG/TraD family ATPase VirD4
LPEREERKVAAPLLRHNEIRMLPPERAILISGGRRPLRLKMPPYFRVGQWRRQAELPPVPHPAPLRGESRDAVGADGRPRFL